MNRPACAQTVLEKVQIRNNTAGGFQVDTLDFTLDKEDVVPPGMVHVRGGQFKWLNLGAVHLDDFWIDKYEVTNRQFKQFVDKGGYRQPNTGAGNS